MDFEPNTSPSILLLQGEEEVLYEPELIGTYDSKAYKICTIFPSKGQDCHFFFIPFIISKSVKVTMPQLEYPLHFLQPSSVNR